MKNLKSKIILIILAVGLIGLLGGCEPPQKFDYLARPIIVVAKSKGGDVVVRDKVGTYLTLGRDYYLAKSIYDTYAVGDTIK